MVFQKYNFSWYFPSTYLQCNEIKLAKNTEAKYTLKVLKKKARTPCMRNET